MQEQTAAVFVHVQWRIQGWFVGIERTTVLDSIYYIEFTPVERWQLKQLTYRLGRRSGYTCYILIAKMLVCTYIRT